jgi:hypothetical protein
MIAETEKAKKEKEKRRRAEKKKVLITMVELGWWEMMGEATMCPAMHEAPDRCCTADVVRSLCIVREIVPPARCDNYIRVVVCTVTIELYNDHHTIAILFPHPLQFIPTVQYTAAITDLQ